MTEKIVLYMPAYKAAGTLKSVYHKIPKDVIDEMFLVDDGPEDGTQAVCRELGIPYTKNESNLGYGGNVKKCLQKALAQGADIIIELHPDDQYDPAVIPAAIAKIREGNDFVLGSRFINAGDALKNGMPFWKYFINRLSSLPARLVLGYPLSDFHTGFRVYHRRFLENSAFQNNHHDYLFSFEIIAQACFGKFRIGEVPVICKYYENVTQINFKRSMVYGRDVLKTLSDYIRAKSGKPSNIFKKTSSSIQEGKHESQPLQVL